MGLPRSTYYDAPAIPADEAEIVARIKAICDEFEIYGYRRVGAALRHLGVVVNGKKVRRLTREHDLQPRRHKRFVATTDSDHSEPIFPKSWPPEPKEHEIQELHRQQIPQQSDTTCDKQ